MAQPGRTRTHATFGRPSRRPDRSGFDPQALYQAISNESVSRVRALLSKQGGKAAVNALVGAADDDPTALHKAVATGNAPIVKLLLGAAADVNARDRLGRTPLFKACRDGEETIAQLLLSAGADVTIAAMSGMLPLHAAADGTRDLGSYRALSLEHELNDDGGDDGDDGGSARGVRFGGVEVQTTVILPGSEEEARRYETVCAALLSWGATVDATDKHGQTALMLAAARGNVAVVEMLLRRGAEPDARDVLGQSALHRAAQSGHKGSLEALLGAGCSARAKDVIDWRPLHWAVYNSHAECVAELLRREPDVVAMGNRFKFDKPVALVAHNMKRDDLRVFDLLTEDQPNVQQAADGLGRTVLHYAAMAGHKPLLTHMLAISKVKNPLDKGRNQPLHLAVRGGHVEAATIILHAGCPVDPRDELGRTPLHWAALVGRYDLVVLLLNAGASVTVVDKQGKTPLEVAAHEAQVGVIDVMARHVELKTLNAVDVWSSKSIVSGMPATAQASLLKLLSVLDHHAEAVRDAHAEAQQPEESLSVPTRARRSHSGSSVASADGDRAGTIERKTSFSILEIPPELLGTVKSKAADVRKKSRLALESMLDDERSVAAAISASKQSLPVTMLSSGGSTGTSTPTSTGDSVPPTPMTVRVSRLSTMMAARTANVINKAAKQAQVSMDSSSQRRRLSHLEKDAARLAKALVPEAHETAEDKLFGAGGMATVDDLAALPALPDINAKAPVVIRLAHALLGRTPLTARRVMNELPASGLAGITDIGSSVPGAGGIIHFAVYSGSADVVKRLLGMRPDLHVVDDKGQTPLHWAARCGNATMVHLLVAKYSVLAKDRKGRTPLHVAAQRQSASCIKALIESSASAHPEMMDLADGLGATALHWSCAMGDLKSAVLLTGGGAGVDCLDAKGMSPLLWATSVGRADVVAFLLKSRASVDVADTVHGETVLHKAVLHGSLEVIRFLLDKLPVDARRSLLCQRDAVGRSALHWAILCEDMVTIRTLLQHEYFEVRETTVDQTPLHYAALVGMVDVVKLLLDKGAAKDAPDANMETPLHIAANEGRTDCVYVLMKRRANPRAKNRDGLTALDHAVMRHHVGCVALLSDTLFREPSEVRPGDDSVPSKDAVVASSVTKLSASTLQPSKSENAVQDAIRVIDEAPSASISTSSSMPSISRGLVATQVMDVRDSLVGELQSMEAAFANVHSTHVVRYQLDEDALVSEAPSRIPSDEEFVADLRETMRLADGDGKVAVRSFGVSDDEHESDVEGDPDEKAIVEPLTVDGVVDWLADLGFTTDA